MASQGVMISRELQVTLQLAMTEALNRRHEYVCLEHVLYAMLHDVTTSNVLKHCGADLDALRSKLQSTSMTRSSAWPRRRRSRTTRPACSARCSAPRCTRSRRDARKSTVRQVLVAMFHETESHAVFLLQEQGVTRFDVINFISHGVSKIGADDDREVRGANEGQAESEDDTITKKARATRMRKARRNFRRQGAQDLRDKSCRTRRQGQDRSADRAQERNRARDPYPAAPAQEQSGVRRRGRRRQDRAGRGSGARDP